MEKREQLYEGKAKKVYATDDPGAVHSLLQGRRHRLQRPEKRGTIMGKGVINNRLTNHLMQPAGGKRRPHPLR